jgi:hypothetical protein
LSIPPANSFKLCTLKTQKGTNLLYQDLTYTFTADGNVDLITDPINGNQDFGYDGLDRLTSATGPYGTGGATATFTYTYNQIGNILTNSQLTAGAFTYPTSGPGVVRPHASGLPVPIRIATTTMATRRASRVRSAITAPARRLTSTIAWRAP